MKISGRLTPCLSLFLFMALLLAASAPDSEADQNAQAEYDQSLREDIPQPLPVLCPDIVYVVEPDFGFKESELTPDNNAKAIQFMTEELPGWMEDKYQRGKLTERADDRLMEGDVSMAYYNRLMLLKLYALKLEALSAAEDERDAMTEDFCQTLSRFARID